MTYFWFKKMGKAMIMDSDRDKTLVQELMRFKSKLDTVIVDCFGSNEKFLHSLRDSFDFFVNTRANKIAELIGTLNYKPVHLLLTFTFLNKNLLSILFS